MNEKKVIAFIVERPSEEAALGSIMKEFFSSNEVQFVVVHGDITLKDYVSVDTIRSKINKQMEKIKSRYRYQYKDFLKIIHIVDTDGVYIPEHDVQLADIDGVRYSMDRIETRNPESIVKRNTIKGKILYKLRKTGKVHNIPYKVYFNSCNLEHVLYGELRNFTDEEKEEMADQFAEKYEEKVNEFVKLISDPSVAVLDTYQKTWDYIQIEKNSIHRHTNMHLIFE